MTYASCISIVLRVGFRNHACADEEHRDENNTANRTVKKDGYTVVVTR